MIYELSKDIGDLLLAKKFPYPVSYEDGGSDPVAYGPHIEFRRDRRPNADSYEGPMGTNRNARKNAMRRLGAEIRIYAQSTLVGAVTGDHERECEQVIDGVVSAMNHWTKATRSAWDPSEMRYLDKKERGDNDKWAGVVYLIRFQLARGVYDKDYLGVGKPTGTISGIGSVTHVRYTGQPDSAPAIGCGEE